MRASAGALGKIATEKETIDRIEEAKHIAEAAGSPDGLTKLEQAFWYTKHSNK